MAKRRMLHIQLIRQDDFLELPLSAQYLYVQCVMEADDDGFITNPKSLARLLGCTAKDVEALVAKHFLLAFPSGVMAIRHWFWHNVLRKDRYTPSLLPERDKIRRCRDGSYEMATNWQPNGNQMATKWHHR